MSIRWELCARSKKAGIFCTISVEINCRDGSNTFLSTEQQEHQLLRFVLMTWSFNISYYRCYPISTTEVSFFYRLAFILQKQFRILDYSSPLYAVQLQYTVQLMQVSKNEKTLSRFWKLVFCFFCVPKLLRIRVYFEFSKKHHRKYKHSPLLHTIWQQLE